MNEVEERGRRWTYFAGCDYLRFSWHPAVQQALREAVSADGISAGASRSTTGNRAVYEALERALARFFGEATAVLTSSGYVAPMVAVQALAGAHTHVVVDERAHGCLRDAARLSGLPVHAFPKGDPAGLRAVLRSCGRRARVLVLTDGLGSVTGQISPVADYWEVLGSGSTLLVDDAHGAGVLGRRGRGTVERAGLPPGRVVATTTLSKAFGCYGGVVLGSEALRERIRAVGRIYTGNTPIPPALAQASLAALAVMRKEGGARRARLRANVSKLKAAAGEPGGVEDPGPLLIRVPRDEAEMAWVERRLRRVGIHPPWIGYPQGPADRFFRFAIASEHEAGQIEALGAVLAEWRERQAR